MKAIILAAGQSSRFWPLAQDKHKTFYRCGFGKTVIEHTVEDIRQDKAIDEIIVVVASQDVDRAKNMFGEGNKMRYVVQKEPTGEGDALSLCKEFLRDDELFFLTAGHKVNAHAILQILKKAQGEAIAIRSTDQPQHYGVVTVNTENHLTSIVEKPLVEQETLGLKISSAYLLHPRCLNYLQRYLDEQYSLELSLDRYVKDFPVFGARIDSVPEVTLKFPWQLLLINALLQKQMTKTFVHRKAKVAKTAIIKGPVFIDEGAQIFEFTKVIGPAYIGRNVIIGDYTSVRENCFFDDGVMIGAHSEIKNAILYHGGHFHNNYIGDSIFGEECKIGAGTIVANRRLDRAHVSSIIKGSSVSSAMPYLGTIAGNDVRMGVNCSVMPGVKLGSKSHVWPNCVVYRDIPDGAIYKGGTEVGGP